MKWAKKRRGDTSVHGVDTHIRPLIEGELVEPGGEIIGRESQAGWVIPVDDEYRMNLLVRVRQHVLEHCDRCPVREACRPPCPHGVIELKEMLR